MANEELSVFTELAEGPAIADLFGVVDVSDTTDAASGTTKRNKAQFALGSQVNAQTGTTYTYLTTDFRKLVTHSNASAIAGTLPQAGASFPAGWWMYVQNRGAGALTITPTTSTIDGAATLVLNQNEGAIVVSDGTNYFTLRGKATGAAGVGDVVGPASATDNALARFDSTTGKLIQDSALTADDNGVIGFPDNVRQTFNPGANAAGLNVGAIAGDPDTPSNGDLWYDSTANELTGRINGANVALGAGGGGPATQIDETGGPTTLDIAAIADGQFLKRSGTDIVGDAPTASIAPLVIEDANTVAQRNGATNQNFRVHGVFNSATDYTRIRIGFASGVAQIMSEAQTQTPSNLRLRVGSNAAHGFNFSDAALIPVTDITMSLGESGKYFTEIYNRDWITRSGGMLRFVSGSRLTGPAQGILNITDDNANSGSGTIRFDSRSPAQISADQNDYSIPVTGYFIRLSTNASRTLTGLTFGGGGKGDGQVHLLVNVGSNDLVLAHENASSTAANRFLCSTGASITLGANQAADLIYDGTTERWRVFKRS